MTSHSCRNSTTSTLALVELELPIDLFTPHTELSGGAEMVPDSLEIRYWKMRTFTRGNKTSVVGAELLAISELGFAGVCLGLTNSED